jgi:hypothetical protein
MKKRGHIPMFLILTIVVGSSCSSENAGISNENIISSRSKSVPAETKQPALTSSSDLATIREYAESYEPRSGREVIPSPPIPSDKIMAIITNLANSKSREHEKYILLIFLRLSRFQVEHFKQRYELGRENPLTKEFYRLIGKDDYETAEFIPASLADKYVEQHPKLLEYPLIEAEMKRIANAGQKTQNPIPN